MRRKKDYILSGTLVDLSRPTRFFEHVENLAVVLFEHHRFDARSEPTAAIIEALKSSQVQILAR